MELRGSKVLNLKFFYFVIVVGLIVACSMARRVIVLLFVAGVLYLYEERFGVFLLLTFTFLAGVASLYGPWFAIFLLFLGPMSVAGRVVFLCIGHVIRYLYEHCFPLYVCVLLSLALILLWFR